MSKIMADRSRRAAFAARGIFLEVKHTRYMPRMYVRDDVPAARQSEMPVNNMIVGRGSVCCRGPYAFGRQRVSRSRFP